MTDTPRQAGSDDLVYMVTGVDENGDTHIFVTRPAGKVAEVLSDWLGSIEFGESA